jgi:hypothetical protein
MCQLCKACSSINHFTAFTSHRTTQFIVIDRLLIEHNLFGRVARKRHPLMNPKKRLSFAHGIITCHEIS